MAQASSWVFGAGVVLAVSAAWLGCVGAGRTAHSGGAAAPGASDSAGASQAVANASAAPANAAPANAAPVNVTDPGALLKKCESGEGPACRALAESYANGKGVGKDELSAAVLLEKACDKKIADACAVAGDLRYFPNSDLGDTSAKGPLKNDQLAAADAKKGCTGGSMAACVLYARMEIYGRTPEPDRKHAFDELQKGCSSSEPPSVVGPACNMLGYAYETGSGIDADIAKARSLYEKACSLKYWPGCGRVGDLFVTGQGGEKNAKKASSYYQQACKGGVAESCDALKDLPK